MNPKSTKPAPFPGRETVAPALPPGPDPVVEKAVPKATRATKPSPMAELPRVEAGPRARWMALALLAASLFPIALLFGPRFPELVRSWRQDADSVHGFLILPLSALLAWWVGRCQGWPAEREPKTGLRWTASGCLLHLAALALRQPLLDFPALAAVLYGLAVTLGGRDWARGFRLPIALLFLLVPGPVIPAPVGGVVQGLPGLLAVALVAGRLYRCSLRGRVLLVAAVVPVTVAANLLRLGLLALTPTSAGDAPPGAWALLALAAGLGMLLTLASRMGREAYDPPPPTPYFPEPWLPAGWASSLGMVMACVILCLVAQAGLRAALKVDGSATGLRQPLGSFPVVVGSWSSASTVVHAEVPDLLPPFGAHFPDAADRIERVYALRDPEGDGAITCRVGMAYYPEGQGHDHNPFVCYQVTGVAEDLPGRAKLWLDSLRVPVQRLCFRGQGWRRYVFSWRYTWRPANGERPSLLPTPDQRRTRGPASLTIEVVTRAATAQQLNQVADLLRAVDREIQTYLPANAQLENAARIDR
jgi:hypothetical protein